MGEAVKIGSNCDLRKCQLQHSVNLPGKLTLCDKILISESVGESCEKLGSAAFIKSAGGGDSDSEGGVADDDHVTWLEDPYADSELEDDASSVTVSEESRSVSPEADDCTSKSPAILTHFLQ